jgi:hypothetical protein
MKKVGGVKTRRKWSPEKPGTHGRKQQKGGLKVDRAMK